MPQRPSSSSSGSHPSIQYTTRSSEGYNSNYPLVHNGQAGDQNLTFPTGGNNDLNSSYLPQNVTLRRPERPVSNIQTEPQPDTAQMGDTTLRRYVADIQSACQCTGSINPECRVHAGSDEYYVAWAAEVIYLYNRQQRTAGSLQSAPTSGSELDLPPSAHTSAHSTPAARRPSGVATHMERSPDVSKITSVDGDTSFASQARDTIVKSADAQSHKGRLNKSSRYNLFEDSRTEYDALYSNQGTNKKSSQVNKQIFRNTAPTSTVSSVPVQGSLLEKPSIDFTKYMREKREAAKEKLRDINLGLHSLKSNTMQFMKALDFSKPSAPTGAGARPKRQSPRRDVPINKVCPQRYPFITHLAVSTFPQRAYHQLRQVSTSKSRHPTSQVPIQRH